MHSLVEDMRDFREQLEKGSIQKAYRALISYMMDLRTHFKDFAVSGLYQGYMDMTYFALFPPSLKRRGLKIAIVFNYDTFRFEAWLAGSNRNIQRQYWKLLKDGQWPEYRVVTPASGVDSIIECDLATDFDLSHPASLTSSIEATVLEFIGNIENFLSMQQPGDETPK